MGILEDLELFVRIVDAGSVSKAARDMGLAKSAVSRRLTLLEDRFNTSLIHRKPGKWAVTDRGAELYGRAQTLVHQVGILNADFSDARLALKGPLTLSLPRDFGLAFLSTPLRAFADQHPGLTLHLALDDRFVDLRHENIDAALRISRALPEGVEAESLGETQAHLCASPAYLAQAANLRTPADLVHHTWLGYGLNHQHTLQIGATRLTLTPHHRSNSGTQLRHWALAGWGVTALPDFLISDDLAEGRLACLLPTHPLPGLGLYLCTPSGAAPNRRVRLFAQFLKNLLAEHPFVGGSFTDTNFHRKTSAC